MESSRTLPQENLTLHIEYAYDEDDFQIDGIAANPFIVISFSTVDQAEKLFCKMKDEWCLNVKLRNNLIIIKDSINRYGANYHFGKNHIYINFPPPSSNNIPPAQEFVDLIESSRKNSDKLPALIIKKDRRVELVNLIHP